MQKHKFIKDGESISLATFYSRIKASKRSRAYVAAGLSLVLAAVVVWLWQFLASPSRNLADASTTPNIGSSSEIQSNTETQSGSQPGGNSVTVQSNGSGPASIMVNGQPVDVPQNGSVHKDVSSPNGSTNVSVNVSNGSANNNSSQSTSIFSNNTSSFSTSSDQVNSYTYSYTSGGGSASN